jgi:transposase
MMGKRRVCQGALFYEFSLEDHVPEGHLLRSIDRFVELNGLRQELASYYSEKGRPSIDPELLIRMLTSASKPEITSKSSSSMPLWRSW